MAYPVDPTKYPVSTPYGVRGPRWSSGHHEGVDFACPVGTRVYAPIDGVCVGTGTTWGSAFGRHQVVIQISKNEYLLFAHMKADYVKSGDRIKAGTLIGLSGAEGNVSGPHLHMELQNHNLWHRGAGVNPQKVLDYVPLTPVFYGPPAAAKAAAKAPAKKSAAKKN